MSGKVFMRSSPSPSREIQTGISSSDSPNGHVGSNYQNNGQLGQFAYQRPVQIEDKSGNKTSIGISQAQQLEDIELFQARLKSVTSRATKEKLAHRIFLATLLGLDFVSVIYVLVNSVHYSSLSLWMFFDIPSSTYLVAVLCGLVTGFSMYHKDKFFPATLYVDRCNVVLRDFGVFFDPTSGKLWNLPGHGGADSPTQSQPPSLSHSSLSPISPSLQSRQQQQRQQQEFGVFGTGRTNVGFGNQPS